jgi:ribonucleotide reductase alpha subunit
MSETVGTHSTGDAASPPQQRPGLRIERVYTTPGVHPYDEVTWERRDVVMTNWRDGSVNFEQRGVEFPDFWSVNAANIVTTKYFRGAVGTPQRESSLRQLLDRVVHSYRAAGERHGYFATPDDAEIFEHELTWMLLHQVFSFNSPVWFNVGTDAPQQVSACQPYDALVSTPAGLVPIGKLVEDNAVGTKVYDAHGLTRIVATKANGVKDVLRLHTKAGYALDVTADHLVWKSTQGASSRFVPAGQLQPGDQLAWHRRSSHGEAEISSTDIAEAALAGWLQSDGFVGQYAGTNRSLTIEAMTVTEAERQWVLRAIAVALPGLHRHERAVSTMDNALDCRRNRIYGAGLQDFVARWDLLTRGIDMSVPTRLYTAPLPVVAAYLRSLFQAEGYVSARERSTLLAMAMISEQLIRGVQKLLLRFGIFARVGRKIDRRVNRHDLWEIRIQNAGDRRIFADEIGFIDSAKADKLEASFDLPGRSATLVKRLEVARIERLGAMEVYDIQTESGEYLSGNLRVHNCFILAVDDTMDSILNWYREEGLIFKGGSGAGLNLSRIRSSKELLSSGGTASGPVSFMRGADASAGTIKSGGATRRAAKMVVLDVDHPDVEEFIETKAREEEKIRVLRDAGYDMDLGGKDITSVQYQNANNSVRVSDEFMQAVEEGKEFGLRARLTHEVLETVDAKTLFRKMAQAAWECADPGIQYDDTINDWHTNPETGRITASNPCFPSDQRVVTDKGLVPIGELVRRAASGETFDVYTNDVTASESPSPRVVASTPVRYMVTGTNEILELRFSDGSRLRCTPGHRIWTQNRGWVHAEELAPADRVVRSFHHAARSSASRSLPAAAVERACSGRGSTLVDVPEKWDDELAHYLGWLVGDGCVTDDGAVTVYGGQWEQQQMLPRHAALLRRITGHDRLPSVQLNGTRQLRSMQRRFREFLLGLGVSQGRAAAKVLPEVVFEAPEDALCAFLRGLFDADGCVVNQREKGTRYVGLGSRSEELLIGVQELLASLGIAGRIYRTGVKSDSFTYTRSDGSSAVYGSNGPSYDLRISGRHIAHFRSLIGFDHAEKAAKLDALVADHDFYRVDETVRLVSRESQGFETTYNLTEPRNHSYVVSGVVVANCSEYLSLDNSSCNLASLNLMKFLRDDGTFDGERFVKAVELVITAMDISICFADFPTKAIGEITRAYRQLGIGYANLGALLMATGHAYDSDGGRALSAAITSLMTGTAYRRSAELAGVVGPYHGYARNATAHQRVMRKHAAANDTVRSAGADDAVVLRLATEQWQDGLRIGATNGWRNAQASVLAPTGTIGFMMDCDTTGIEPDFSLVKFKKLVGGGSMQIVNQTVPRALRSLGYQEEQVEAIVEYISEHGHVVDAPGLRSEHYEVFDCAMGTRSIAPMGHVRMMAAVQPFISGGISKTVNMPESATVEDIERIYFEGWKLGLKALAIYRDNCKVGQPLSDQKKAAAKAEPEKVVEYRPIRKRLPKKRPSQTVSFSVGGAEGYATSSSYPDDGLGELFVKMSKQGSTLAGVMDAFSIAISIALQYGVPLETYVSKFVNMRFDPAGMTDDPDIRIASSVMDYLFRRLALDYLPYEKRAELGIFTAAERAAAVADSYGGGNSDASDEVEAEVAAMRSSAPVEKGPAEKGPAGNAEKSATAELTPIETAAVKPAPAEAHSSAELLELQQGTVADAPLCFTCGTKMRPAGSCYVCEGCGSTSGCS